MLAAIFVAGCNNNCKIRYTADDEISISSECFDAKITSHKFKDGQGVLTFDKAITKIGEKAFSGCIFMTSITIPNSIKEIESAAFYWCGKLRSITIPNRVTTIRQGAFFGCISLTNITIPKNVTTIRQGAFFGCTSLRSVYCKATTPPTGASQMFGNNAADRIIYVPRNSVSAYKSASYWCDYADYIVGYDF